MARRYRDSDSRRKMRDMARSRKIRVSGYTRDRAGRRDYGDYNSSKYYLRYSDNAYDRDSARGRRDYQRDRQSYGHYDLNGDMRDYSDYADYNDRRDYRDYADYNDRRDYRGDRDYADRRDYRDYTDSRGDRDYSDYRDNASKGGNYLSDDELMEWAKQLYQQLSENEKQLFSKEMVERKASDYGIKFDKFSFEEFYVTTLMLFSDYKDALGTGNIDHYVKLAKLWLCDEDAEMQYGEKLAAYYDSIVVGE